MECNEKSKTLALKSYKGVEGMARRKIPMKRKNTKNGRKDEAEEAWRMRGRNQVEELRAKVCKRELS